MKKVIKFHKAFLACALFSLLVIGFGLFGFFTKGFNFSIDFKPGLIEEVRIAPAAMEVSYSGDANVTVDISNTAIDLVISGVGAENRTQTFTFGQNATVSAMAQALSSVEGVTATVLGSANADSYGLYVDSASTTRLSADTKLLLYVPVSGAASIDQIRAAVASVSDAQVKELGTEESRSFQIRAGVSDDGSSEELLSAIGNGLNAAFGAEKVAVVKTDFVASSFSKNLASKSILLALATMLLIWLYATIRFHWDFALGAIIALLHDVLIMVAFIVWTQTEFSTTTLAGVLTIIGYSINATVVILDRIRENMKLVNTKDFNDIIDKSLSDTLARSIITTVTTLFAAIALLVFTTGSIQDFAKVLTVGLISGCYSSMFISMGFISFMRRHWEPGENANRVRPRKETAHKFAEQ